MGAPIFVSHASEDIESVSKLIEELEGHDIQVWTSFRDIPPSSEWDVEIQNALDKASHVIVIASEISINSSYVRAEVEYALDNEKKVIPVLIGKVKIPPRWHTLQHIDLTNNDREKQMEKLLQVLPSSLSDQFANYLADPANYDLLKNLIYQHPRCVCTRGATRGGCSVDTISYLLDSGEVVEMYGHSGIRSHGEFHIQTAYLCSPYDPPFNLNGEPSNELNSKLENALRHGRELISKERVSYVADITIYVYAGQRYHFTEEMVQHRIASHHVYSAKMNQIIRGHPYDLEKTLVIASFTRIQEQLKQWYP